MRSRSLVVAALAALPLLAGAACGSDDNNDAGGAGGDRAGLSAEAQAYADAWARSLVDEEDGLGVNQADADCMARIMMAELGVEVFEEAGVEPGDIDPEDRDAVGDDEIEDDADDDDDDSPGELLGAGVVSDEQTDAILDQWEGCTDLAVAFADGFGEELGLGEDAQSCIVEQLDDGDLLRASLRPSFTSDDDEPPADVLSELIEVVTECGDEGDGVNPIVAEIAADIADDGTVTPEQAQCIAQAMVDAIGLDRLLELGAGDTDLDDADPAVQQEVAQAVLGAADACGVPLSALGG